MPHQSRFWDKVADRYAKKPVGDQAAYLKKLEVTRGYLRPDFEVLEVGCGTGSTAIVHAPHVNHIQAVDISSKMLAIAQAKADAENVTNLTFVQADVDAFSAPEASFDAVLALSVLHLVHDRDAAIAKVNKLLKPGGIFVSSTPCIGDKMAYFKLIAPVAKFFGLFPLLRVFKVQDLVDSLIGAGFAIDHQWQPGKGMSVFIVAKKAG